MDIETRLRINRNDEWVRMDTYQAGGTFWDVHWFGVTLCLVAASPIVILVLKWIVNI